MPTLPTLTVTDAQATRMIAAFGSAEAYRTWLKEQIIDYVVAKELEVKKVQKENELKTLDATARSELGA